MKIYTKTGDKGETSLLAGSRTSKADERIEAYGAVDELNAFIGLLQDKIEAQVASGTLKGIQRHLFIMGSILAAEKQVDYLPKFNPDNTLELEKAIDLMDAELEPLQNFILPGGHEWVSFAHICRTICRRAERNVVKITQPVIQKEEIVVYLNRLSDYFFVLARWIAKEVGAKENIWKP